MPLTDDEMMAARSWIGETVSDETINERYDRLGDINLAIEEELRSQSVAMAQRPTNLALPSGLSLGFGQNITAAESRLKDFLSSGGVSSIGVKITKLYRKQER